MGSVFRITNDTLHPLPGKKVIKADEYATLVEAQQIITDARTRADAILSEAQQHYENERKRGYEDGLIEGKMNMAEHMMENIASSVDYLERMESTIVNLVMQSLRKILHDMDDHERTQKVVHKALSYVRAEKKVVLKVSPEDIETVRGSLDDLLRDYPAIRFLDVAADARLSKGACILESDMGVVDAGIETQLAAIERAFHSHLNKDKG